ncbi:MAG: rhamnogalacturonan lyase, partial [Lachnospiraceae bacterium]|nr:rhamnogalacturonan lyase [Lachnospiraceae bacterium]
DKPYLEIPLQIPPSGITPAGEAYSYHANDMSIGDIDGDGEYEFFVKWDPTNSHDVSIKGYTGNCYIDCYRLNGTLLWRLDMGVNIRAGAHYTQFMVYDFNGDGMAEMAVKTAPGTKMTIYEEDGTVKKEYYITMSQEDLEKGYSNQDDYRLSADGYYKHITEVFRHWTEHEMVQAKIWPETLEECFGIPKEYEYPLSETDAKKLADYFIDVYAPSRSKKNDLRHFEGFIIDGPEYLTMFSGKGEEMQTIPFKYGRQDDGLMWGDYAMPRIEPANRVDRFLSGVAYLDGERPYLIVCRGYYTRTTIVAYQFFENEFKEHFAIDSGHILMDNPFQANPHITVGTDPVYGKLAGQGNHSLSTADVDFDGCMEIIYGAAVIDHDGSLLYSSFDYLPDKKTYIKLGHGDAMHVADIDPDKPGLEIFNVFEAGKWGPYGYALRDAMTGKVLFGEYSEKDLGRCMIGDINPFVRGLQTWVYQVQDVNGNVLDDPLLGTDQNIHWAADLSTQVLDGVDLFGHHTGIINDNIHGIMLKPEGVAMNNGTKGNPCLVADLFGDWREELLVRTEDDSAIRIYTNTDITSHKLFTLLHDTQYRCGIAWQNNCYNQPCYTKFYLASDMDWEYVLPQLAKEDI